VVKVCMIVPFGGGYPVICFRFLGGQVCRGDTGFCARSVNASEYTRSANVSSSPFYTQFRAL